MLKKTKIIATVGPASESEEILNKLIESGVNLFRFNLKHNSFEWHKKTIEKTLDVAKKNKKRVAIIADLQGPEIRLETKNGEDLKIEKGESLFISDKFLENKKTIKINPGLILKKIKLEDKIFIDNGDLELKIVEKKGNYLEVKSEREIVIKDRKSINIPSAEMELPLFSNKDMEILARMNNLKIDYLALSFVRSREDLEILKKILIKINPHIKVIAKIENKKAIENIGEIISIADAIMIARGDLGIEVPIRELAFWQKNIIDLCRKNSKPVIVATQMLKSMIENHRPSRSEATDISNAVFDGTDALMLSEETAIGKYPVKSVEEMSNIVVFSENNGEVKNIKIEPESSTEILVDAAVRIIKDSKKLPIKAAIIFTESGNTAKIFSRYRLNIPTIAITDKKETANELTLSYGIESYLKKFNHESFKMSEDLNKEISSFDFINKGDNLILIHGNNWIESGSTSDISLITI